MCQTFKNQELIPEGKEVCPSMLGFETWNYFHILIVQRCVWQ